MIRPCLPSCLLLLLITAVAGGAAEHKSIFPPGVKPVGPYSPGVVTADFLYVSGQGSRDLANKLPESLEGQVRQCLENVKTIVEAGGLRMENVVTTQVYLADIAGIETLNRVWKEYFPKNEPARTVIGVARMPTGTPVEIAATALRNLSSRKVTAGAVGAGDRVFLAGSLGRGSDTASQVKSMVAGTQSALRAASLSLRNLAYVNIYVDASLPVAEVVKLLEKSIPRETARTVIRTPALPSGARVQMSGVASRTVKPSGSCAEVGDTLYCSGRAGATREVLEGLGGDLKAAGTSLGQAVASNVYIDDLDQFGVMNKLYATYFGAVAPTRTTVQPIQSGPASATGDAGNPGVQVAVVVVRQVIGHKTTSGRVKK